LHLRYVTKQSQQDFDDCGHCGCPWVETGIKFLQNHCAGVGMDGVVWIMGEASGAFTLLGLLSQKTVLMEAAQDGTNHEEA
jgi:hypothetical protein